MIKKLKKLEYKISMQIADNVNPYIVIFNILFIKLAVDRKKS